RVDHGEVRLVRAALGEQRRRQPQPDDGEEEDEGDDRLRIAQELAPGRRPRRAGCRLGGRASRLSRGMDLRVELGGQWTLACGLSQPLTMSVVRFTAVTRRTPKTARPRMTGMSPWREACSA